MICDRRCVCCGQQAHERHHPARRVFVPSWVVNVCDECHQELSRFQRVGNVPTSVLSPADVLRAVMQGIADVVDLAVFRQRGCEPSLYRLSESVGRMIGGKQLGRWESQRQLEHRCDGHGILDLAVEPLTADSASELLSAILTAFSQLLGIPALSADAALTSRLMSRWQDLRPESDRHQNLLARIASNPTASLRQLSTSTVDFWLSSIVEILFGELPSAVDSLRTVNDALEVDGILPA